MLKVLDLTLLEVVMPWKQTHKIRKHVREVDRATDLLVLSFFFFIGKEVLILYDGSEVIPGFGGRETRQTIIVFLKYPQLERRDRNSKINA